MSSMSPSFWIESVEKLSTHSPHSSATGQLPLYSLTSEMWLFYMIKLLWIRLFGFDSSHIMLSRFIHIVASLRISFLLKIKYYYSVLCIWPLRAIWMASSLWLLWRILLQTRVYTFVFKLLLSGNGLAGFYSNSVFRFLKNHYFFFLEVDAPFVSPQQLTGLWLLAHLQWLSEWINQ